MTPINMTTDDWQSASVVN